MSILGSIDVGSNTLRMLIASVEGGSLRRLSSDRCITRLGDGVAGTGAIQAQNIEASLNVLKRFADSLSDHGVDKTRAVATSAVRESSNSELFLKKAYESTGIRIDVISGEKEAELTAKGVLASLRGRLTGHVQLCSASSLIVDMGGGSTEWILCSGGDMIGMGSLPLGVIPLARNFIRTDPVREEEISALRDEITPFIRELHRKMAPVLKKETCLIGTAGTFSTIASIDLRLEEYLAERVHLHTVPLGRVLDMANRLGNLPLTERKRVAGLEPERADLIIPGLHFTINLMQILGFKELTISDWGLLEGAILELAG